MNNKKFKLSSRACRGISANLHLSADIAEDAKLNFELDKWFWMPYRKGFALRGMTVLFLLTCFSPLARAETCTPTPDCKTLGYTETSCPDGGVKCPWNTSLMYCCKKCVTCEVKTCQLGDVLYSDKKCYTCPNAYTLPGIPPIGVVFETGKAVALTDLSEEMNWSKANSACSSYSVGGVSGWYLPTKDELLAMYSNRSSVVQGFRNTIVEVKDFTSDAYWSSSPTSGSYWLVNPVSGNSKDYADYSYYVRPVLAF